MTVELRRAFTPLAQSPIACLARGLSVGALLVVLVGLPTPGLAADSPFGEPEPILPGSSWFDFEGPYGVNSVGPALTAPTAIFLAGPGGDDGAFARGFGLWRTDGTSEGTHRVQSSAASFFGVLPTQGRYHWLHEVRGDGTVSLWRTDGTPGGTIPLADGLHASGDFTYHRERQLLFFSAGPYDPAQPKAFYFELEPWVSDGTRSGTRLVRDLVPGSGSRPRAYRAFGRDVVFLAWNPETFFTGLWRSDGTPEGTRLVAVPPDSGFVSLHVVGDAIFLVAEAPERPGVPISLWRSDGTPAGTHPVRSFGPLTPGVAQIRARLSGDLGDGRSLWAVETRDVPASLWVTDGTEAGTRQLMPLVPLAPGFQPQPVLPYRGEFYFQADDGTTGQELWRTDGTPEGTAPAFETCPGTCSNLYGLRRVRDGLLVIWARDDAHGLEEWVTDGTAEGTEVLLDLCPGPCSPQSFIAYDGNGYRIYSMRPPHGGALQLWGTDFTPEGTRQLTDIAAGVTYGRVIGHGPVNGRHLFLEGYDVGPKALWSLTVPTEPAPPLGTWLESPSVPGFDFKVRITGGSGSIPGTQEPSCIPETVCVSGAVPGRSEVFLRVVGPKPNGRLWPTLVKFSTSTVEVWVRQDGTGEVRYYRLEGARPGVDELPGLFDRTGFAPMAGGAAGVAPLGLTMAEPIVLAAGDAPEAPAAVFTSEHFPGYRFRARISSGEQVQEVRKEAECIEETLCLSGALPGRSEVFVRLVGPKPNGRMWPTVVKFTTSTVEVWIEQVSTGDERYYRIEGAGPGVDDLTGLFDRDGFAP